MKIRVVDFETLGVEPTDPICQVGQCDLVIGDDGVATIGPPSGIFINPGRPIPAQARAVHHIRPKDVENAPHIDVGFANLREGSPDYYCAHNSAFEQQYFTGGNGAKWICTLKAGRRLWPDAPGHSNQVLRYHLGVDEMEGFEPWLAMPPHRAPPDCYTTAWILSEALKLATPDQMVEWTGQPSLLPGAIQFSKYRGTLWGDLDTGFLEWILRQPGMDEDKKFTARHWLERRRADAR